MPLEQQQPAPPVAKQVKMPQGFKHPELADPLQKPAAPCSPLQPPSSRNLAQDSKRTPKSSRQSGNPSKPTPETSRESAEPSNPSPKTSNESPEPSKSGPKTSNESAEPSKPNPETSKESAVPDRKSQAGDGFSRHLDTLVETQPDEQLEEWRREPPESQAPDGATGELLTPKTEANPSPSPKKAQALNDRVSSVPLLGDRNATQPTLGAPTLSKAAIDQRARRIFSLRANGQKKVSQHVWDEWHKGKGSKERANLEQIFARCGYSHDPWLAVMWAGIGLWGSRLSRVS